MKEKKLIANTVGVAPLGDPHFGENTLESPKAYTNSKSKIKTLTSDHKAITLIALVITIIVMLILVAVTVTVAIKGGLFTTAKQATTDTQYHADREMLLSAVIGAINNDAEVDFTKLDANLPQGFKGTQGEYTSEAGNTFYVDSNGNITDEKVGPSRPQVTADGETVTLTRDNVADYLGREVTNYVGKESVEINGETYNVSTQYRLYYVDFDNKYGDGEGTVYLKADCNGEEYSLKTEPTPENPSITDAIKIKNLNPGLYNEEDKNGFPIKDQTVSPPSTDYEHMQAVTWLTDTTNWNRLKPTEYTDGITGEDFNYIVGEPSLEMMMDSYNTHYKLEGDEPVVETDLKDTNSRVKLFYIYPYGELTCGYGVGPRSYGGYSEQFTGDYTVKEDAKIGTMYFPGQDSTYWLSSPSTSSMGDIFCVSALGGGRIGTGDTEGDWTRWFCILPISFFKILSPIKIEIVVGSAEFKDKYSNRRS